MAASAFGVFLALLAVSSALPVDHVIMKADPGPRYQYVVGPDGAELVDLWWKASDLIEARRFNAETQVFFHLFTRSNPTVSQPLVLGVQDILAASNFDASKKTVFLVHGWRNTPHHDFNVHLIHAYLVAEDVNLIMVDWSIGAGAIYIVAIANSIRSALDPALPGWIINPSAFKSTDGKYTEVIHTDLGFAGRIRPLGDVDFYPNRGFNMPGCATLPYNPVIRKLDDGLRYQYMEGPDGSLHLVDLWGKVSDVAEASRYNPDRQNVYHLYTR
ncbi:hypothetical protein HF086_009804 [Spodoptera exigua]|uniref:Lipase domain-containing protein n=1 Tax=Spodoptera exigua TaxID=7107 RepID=A0A922M0H1_SPOEX|nr:hypothetical protein HF086_009804 [Spodoptera exigua]